MQPNLPILLAASNAILKPGGLLRWNKRLVKDARLLLPLTEVMKTAKAYITASRRASSAIAKAKTEAWQTTCSLGQTALFLFLLVRAAPAFLPTVLSVALRPLFSFQQAQYAQVFPLKPAPFCTLFAGLGSTNKSAISLLFSYYDSRSVLATMSSPPSFLLSQTLRQTWQELSSLSCSIRLQWAPDTHFYRETTRLMS